MLLANGDQTPTGVKFERCGSEHFKYYNQTEVSLYSLIIQVEKLKINDHFCPVNPSFDLKGNTLTSEFLFFEFNIVICTPDPAEGITCDANLNSILPHIQIDVPFVNTYFDFDDYDSPVKTYIDGRLSMNLIPNFYQIDNVFIQ